jgi:hypothetical protein
MEKSPSLEANKSSANPTHSINFMKPENSLPRSKQPYPEPDQSNPSLPILFL